MVSAATGYINALAGIMRTYGGVIGGSIALYVAADRASTPAIAFIFRITATLGWLVTGAFLLGMSFRLRREIELDPDTDGADAELRAWSYAPILTGWIGVAAAAAFAVDALLGKRQR